MQFKKDENSLEYFTINSGRSFIVGIVKLESQIRFSNLGSNSNAIADALSNWMHAVALMIRKLSSYNLGSTDYDYNHLNPIFSIRAESRA